MLPQRPEAPLEVTALAIDGPVWLPAEAPSRGLFTTATPRRAKVLFLATSVGYAEQPLALQGMLPDAPGRLSRELPLFLAESAFLHLGLETNAIIPWVKGRGFAVMSAEWNDSDAADYARSAGAQAAVVLHIQQTGERGGAGRGVVRGGWRDAGGRAGPGAGPSNSAQTGTAALGLWARLANSLLQLAGDAPEHIDAARYQIPAGPALGDYLLRLEQLLAVRCSGTDTAEGGLLSGEREIVRGQLDLALSMPQSFPLRLILHETLLRLRELRPEITAEFRRPVELLQQRYPLEDAAANAILEQQLGKVYGAPQFSPATTFSSAAAQG